MLKHNKKGESIGMILIWFIILAVVLVAGVILAFSGALFGYVADETLPELGGFGDVNGVNSTEVAEYTTSPVQNIVDSIAIFGGIIYILVLITCIGLAFAFKTTGEKTLVVMFFVFTVLMIVASMIVSNIYQDFYDDSDEIGDRLKEQGLLSLLILYGPGIFTIILFIGGAIMFGFGQEPIG